jgi:hypothetical protein
MLGRINTQRPPPRSIPQRQPRPPRVWRSSGKRSAVRPRPRAR